MGTASHENQGVFEEKLSLNFKKDKAGVARSSDQKKGTATFSLEQSFSPYAYHPEEIAGAVRFSLTCSKLGSLLQCVSSILRENRLAFSQHAFCKKQQADGLRIFVFDEIGTTVRVHTVFGDSGFSQSESSHLDGESTPGLLSAGLTYRGAHGVWSRKREIRHCVWFVLH